MLATQYSLTNRANLILNYLLIKKTIATKLNKNTVLLKAFTEDLVLKDTTIPLLETEPVILN